jgi:hypothetical protein
MILVLLLNPKFAIALFRAMAEPQLAVLVLRRTTDAKGKGSGTSPDRFGFLSGREFRPAIRQRPLNDSLIQE